MIAWKRIPFHIDIDPKKPGRTQNWFEMEALEKALGRKITWVYSNLIEPGKTAGSHYHKEHEVLVWVAEGELVMHLRDAHTGAEGQQRPAAGACQRLPRWGQCQRQALPQRHVRQHQAA
jgi:hypothetical protein